MVVEEFVDFWSWIGPAAIWFLVILCVCAVLGTLAGFLISAIRNGPGEAFYSVALVSVQAIPDLVRTSPRRVYALSKLAVQEAIRRRIIIVTFVIFSVALLVGGWFLDVRSDNPHVIYLSFVLFGTQIIMLLLSILISCFSLPQDIANRTIYTVATKPVRPFEIILGRIFGFAFIGTCLLAGIGIVSYFFVIRGLSHDHVVDLDSFELVDQATGITSTGQRASPYALATGFTDQQKHHRHRVEIVRVQPEDLDESMLEGTSGDFLYAFSVLTGAGHRHGVSVSGTPPENLNENGIFSFDGEDDWRQIPELLASAKGQIEIETGGPLAQLQARIPFYADKLTFLDRTGQLSGGTGEDGMSVGEMWEYRQYIDGGTSASRAIFNYTDFFPDRFEDPSLIPVELTIGVYRTHKGDIEKTVSGTLQLRSVVDEVAYISDPIIFESREFEVQQIEIPRKIGIQWRDEQGIVHDDEEMDLFDEFAPDGNVEIWLRCNEAGQYFGVARGDIYFRPKDNSFAFNYFKGFAGIWLQMVIVMSLGVMFSTFVTGAVAMLGSIGGICVMMFRNFIAELASPDMFGGGPIESTYRMIVQENVTNELEQGLATTVMKSLDWVLVKSMEIMSNALPDFPAMSTIENLARGYDIGIDALGTHVAMAIAFCFVMSMIGYFRLKTRELAA